jgi:hypothetical protein
MRFIRRRIVKRTSFRLGWLIAAFMLTALACTCGPLGQAQEGLATAQAIQTQAEGLATQVEESGILETAQAAASQMATTGALETAQPAGTQVGGGGLDQVPDDIPIYSENAGVQIIAGVISYQAHADLATVIEFYKTEMPNNGWELTQDLGQIFIYTKGDRTATFTLQDAQESTVVAIQVQP